MTTTAERIHPTAIISPEAQLADDVCVGPFAILEGPVKVGAGCVIHPHARLIGPLTMGRDNQVWSNAVLGGPPQHAGYRNEPTRVEIGDGNVFRESVTVHRGTTASMVTRIGNQNYFMCGSHVGHDCIVGNRCMLVNNALLGGHCIVEDGVIISGNTGVHQFVRLGRLCFLSGVSGASKDVPPFIMQQYINNVVGLNIVGLRRAGFKSEQISALRRLYHIMYLQGLSVPNALAVAEAELGHVDVVQEYIAFVRQSKRGIAGVRRELQADAA
jgi:UDP-N-acetylglucosamine acyltransferase